MSSISWAITWERSKGITRTLPRNRTRDLCSRCTLHGVLWSLPTFWFTWTKTILTKVLALTLVVGEYKTEAAKEDENGQIVEANLLVLRFKDVEVQDERPDNTLGLGKPTDEVVLLSRVRTSLKRKWLRLKMKHSTYRGISKRPSRNPTCWTSNKMGDALWKSKAVLSLSTTVRTATSFTVKAIDDAVAGKPFDESLMGTLESLAHHWLHWRLPTSSFSRHLQN